MIHIKPFKAIRPTRDKAYLVATRSYLSYTDEVLGNKLAHNPYTFLHIINPHEGRHLPAGRRKYKLVKEVFEHFRDEGILIQDDHEAYYMYRQVKEGNEYIGLVAAVSVKDYAEGRIKRHEKTLTQREKMFTDYLEETGFNAEPVLLTYRDDIRLDKVFARYIEQRSEYEFTSTDKVLHQLWIINNSEDCSLISEVMGQQEALYIADGHHRSSSSHLLSKRINKKNGGDGKDHEFFMAFLIGEEQMKVYDFNRLVKNTTGLGERELVDRLRQNFLVEPMHEGAYKPEKLHEISMYIGGSWYKLVPKTGSFDPGDPVDHLDAQILNKNILKPLFDIKKIKTDDRIGFLPGTEGILSLKEKVDAGEYDVAFALYPVAVEQVKRVADAGKTMPPKSTYIEPKLRSGVTIYQIAKD